MRKFVLVLVPVIIISGAFAQNAVVYTTAEKTGLRIKETARPVFVKAEQPLEKEPCVFIDDSRTFQEFIGIGGAITDASAETFAKLPPQKQKEFLDAYYDTEKGIGYTIGRTNINSCDFSSDFYTYIKDHDTALHTFSIRHDEAYKMPLIKKAMQATGGKMKLYVSPWSPPAWMKDNNSMVGGGKLKPSLRQAWADYYVKFIRAYEKSGIPVWGLSVQNEPMAIQRWESCVFTAEEERDFIKEYLGPTLAQEGLAEKKLIAWDHNRDLVVQRAGTLFSDPAAAKYIWGIGFHWYETWTGGNMQFANLQKVQELFPDVKLIFTEGCQEKFDWKKLNDWSLGEKYAHSMINDFNAGTVAWTDWNILLDEKGGPNHAGNFCFAPVHADTKKGELIYTNAYYYIGHFSKFIKPGAKRITSSSNRDALQTTAFVNPDNSIVVVVMNASDKEIPFRLFTNGMSAPVMSQPHSINTIVINDNGFLKAKGKVIVDQDGETVILRGMGLGGWMLQEGYMFRLGQVGQQYKIKEKIALLVGKEKAEQFYDAWLKNHTTKTDIDSLAAWGFNSIRLPMHYRLYTLSVEEEPVAGKNTWLSKGFELTDSLVAWCKANNMYLILDLHAAPGGQGHDLPISDRDPSKPSLWQSRVNQEKTIALWKKLAERYADETTIGGYDIINEPNWGFDDSTDIRGTNEKNNKPLRELMMKITAAIREADKNHIIIIEGNGFGNNYNGIFPLWDDNIVVSFHKYGTLNTTEGIKRFLDLQEKHNIPLWLGEAGENSNTWFTEAIQLVESRQIGWCWWQQKKMGINNPLEIRIAPSYQVLLNHWVNNGPKPSAAEAEAALNEWLENVKIANNIYRSDVIDAMFRQVNSYETLPYRHHLIKNGTIIKAVDFDYGRSGYAYRDNDTARYQYASPPMPSAGNRGNTYRNDGVDIRRSENGGYYIFHTEDGEWLQYTVDVAEAGEYTISLAVSGTGVISLFNNGNPAGQPATINLKDWNAAEIRNVRLQKGMNKLRVVADKGGFNFGEMKFIR